MKKNTSKITLFFLIAVFILAFFALDLEQYFSLDYIKAQQENFAHFYEKNIILTIALYFGLYIAVTALSLPAATVLTLLAGALFGLWLGVLLVSFASTIGASLALLASRYILRDYVQEKYGHRLNQINEGIKQDGAYYLFALRLIPVFPFFLVNFLMGLSSIRLVTYFFVSQLGMLPATIIYVFVGTQLAQIDSLAGIFEPKLLIGFVMLGIFPLLMKSIIEAEKSLKIMRKFNKPKKFDYNLVAIGAGSAGLVTAYIAAAVKAKVALIEKHKMGGDCLNTGCVPSKALLRSAKILSYSNRSEEFGFKSSKVDFDFAHVMQRVQDIIKKIEPHDSVERYQGLGVDCISGAANIVDPYRVEVNGQVITTKNIVIATGARPYIPNIVGLDKIDYLTSDNIWNLRKLPKRLVVVGGGPVGCELAQAFARFGSKVTIIQSADKLMVREDDEVSQFVLDKFKQEDITVHTNNWVKEITSKAELKKAICSSGLEVSFDELLLAVGRQANIDNFGLQELGIKLRGNKTIDADSYLRTNYPNIFVCGDVTGPYQFTHSAAHQAWYACVNALFGSFKKFKVDYSVIPWATFTDPEVARVGLNEQEAQEQGIAYEVTKYAIDDLDRAIADSQDAGFVKVLTQPGKDKILGVTIVGSHAGDLIAEFVTAMKYNIGLNKILGTIHIYPTMTEANKYAAGNWKKAHAPKAVLNWLESFHKWGRG